MTLHCLNAGEFYANRESESPDMFSFESTTAQASPLMIKYSKVGWSSRTCADRVQTHLEDVKGDVRERRHNVDIKLDLWLSHIARLCDCPAWDECFKGQ